MSRILSCPIPSDINPLSPNGFMFSITKLPELTYFCQQVQIPSVSLGEFEQATPFTIIPIPGERLTFGELNIQFLIDSEMNNYLAIFNWMKGLGFPISNDNYTSYMSSTTPEDLKASAKAYSDGTLHILGNTNRSIRQINFVDLIPITLDTLIFNSTNSDVQYLVGNATFKYTYYIIE